MDQSLSAAVNSLLFAGPWLAIGLALALMFAALSPPIANRYRRFSESTPDLRRDPLPAISILTLRLVRLLASIVGPLFPGVVVRRVQQQLNRTGLNQVLLASEFLTVQFLCTAIPAIALSGLALRGFVPPWSVAVLTVIGFWLPLAWLGDHGTRRRRQVMRDLPLFLDLITLAVQGGVTTAAAIGIAVERGPSGVLRSEFARVLREVRAGAQRHQALRSMSDRLDNAGLAVAIGAIIAAERHGADLAQVLQAQAAQRRHERFLDAEQRAMRAPVKMLLPLILFIFPGTFLILLFPVALQLMDSGLF